VIIQEFIQGIFEAIARAGSVAIQSFSVFRHHPEILIYPYIASLFIAITGPLVSGLAYEIWHSISRPEIIDQVNQVTTVSEPLKVHLGFVTFSFFYTVLVTGYFTCATAAGTLDKLENGRARPLSGIVAVLKHFLRVSRFAFIAIFFLPLGIIAQWRKMKSFRGFFEVIGSSWSLSMANLSPAILYEKQGVLATIRHSVNTLGTAWPENLVLKIGTWAVTIGLIVGTGLLPSMIDRLHLEGGSANAVLILVSILVVATAFVATKVIGSVFTAVLYYKITHEKNT
jgi:hypothetical protein